MEFVFVVPREKLFPEAYPHGFVPFVTNSPDANANDTQEILSEKELCLRIEQEGFFVEREMAERSPQWKQIIPYTIVVCEGEVLCLTRTKKGGEKRLHDKLSIGVGGHINPVDLPADPARPGARNPIGPASQREVLDEELKVEGTFTWQTLGLLNDDSNSVGAVHLGWVQSLTVQGQVSVREVDQLQGRFHSVSELHELLASGANFETWSSLLLPRLDELILKPTGRVIPARSTPACSR